MKINSAFEIIRSNFNNREEEQKVTFEQYKNFLNTCESIITKTWNYYYLTNNNLNLINSLSVVNSDFWGIDKDMRKSNSRMFGTNYISEEEITESNVSLKQSINNNWMIKAQKCLNDMKILLNELKNSETMFLEFSAKSYNQEIKNITQSIYELLEPLAKEIEFKDKSISINYMDPVFTNVFNKIGVSKEDGKFILNNKSIYINKSKHNDNCQSLDPYKMILYMIYLFIMLLNFIESQQDGIENQNE